jgi:hypothetical protein
MINIVYLHVIWKSLTFNYRNVIKVYNWTFQIAINELSEYWFSTFEDSIRILILNE